MQSFYAHTDPENPHKLPEDGGRWQELKEHLEGTATLAGKYASAFGAAEWGYIAGLLHDLGKYSKEFQDKLRASVDAHIEQYSHVDHSTFGAQQINKQWKNGEGKALAYCIAGHHAGLPDGNSNADSCLVKRLNKSLPYRFNCPNSILEHDKPSLPFNPEIIRHGFDISMFIRMLYSCLVDADFLDTEKHMASDKSLLRDGASNSLIELNHKLHRYLEQLKKGTQQTSVNRLRSQILNECLVSAEQEPGLFSLTVPTGGGKTLSSMAFALKHAIQQGFQRIIYVIPYTSIIEQNAAVFREILGDNNVLEHHSNFEPNEEDHRTRLASENWDAPIVVTTNVQFFESLFSSRSSRCRKLHNIARSVVILDEVQSLPDHLLLPCIELLRELSFHYQTSIVLCSATQPAIQKRHDFQDGLDNVREIISDPIQLQSQMKRVAVKHLHQQTDEQIVQMIGSFEQVLCVVNTKKHARNLYQKLRGKEGVFHLSTLMAPIHRSRKFQEIRNCLQDNKPCRVISTQLIEAGVDIDFPVVFRSLSGLDSIAQAAGRCNREGRLDTGQVFIFEPEEGLPPGYFRHTAQTAESVIRRFPDDMLSLEAIEAYFKDYYWLKGNKQLDEKGILEMIQNGLSKCDFPFKQIAEMFKLIEQDTKSVIIPLDNEALEIIESIRYAKNLRSYSRKLQKYTVQIHPRYWDTLMNLGYLEIVQEIFPVLTYPHLYDDETGLNIYEPNNLKPSDLIC